MKHNTIDERAYVCRPVTDLGEPKDGKRADMADELRIPAVSIDAADGIPDATEIGREIFMPTAELSVEPQYNAEYRAWYGTRWCPQQSKFGAREGEHQGADLYVPTGTTLVAVVGPASMQWNPQGGGGKWGNHIFLNFRWNDGRNYTFVYAHLESVIGSAPRKVKVGEAICKSDCTGNAGGPGMFCGTPNPCGGLSDHVHLELFGPSGRMDPIAWLGWNVKYADDNRCVDCQA